MPVKFSEIGTYNKGLVLAIKGNHPKISGMSAYADVSTWLHKEPYDYDLSYGVYACGNNSKRLQGKYVGIKYYCIDKSMDFDMKKRIVHIYDTDDREKTQKFYRLVHTGAAVGLRDNSYSSCDEITEIP